MLDSVIVLLVLFSGLVFKKLGHPPLLGYLLAGFAAHYMGLGNSLLIDTMADIGVLLLLFTIGLKLKLKELLTPQIWTVTSIHMAIVIPLTAMVILFASSFAEGLQLPGGNAVWVLAFALSFSSTVYAVQVFSERGEGNSFHAAIAIGILVFQDIGAVVYLVFSSGEWPHQYAIFLLLLPLIRPVLLWLINFAGHGELLVLFGMTAALGMGELFEAVHLKAGLGALVAGVLINNSSKTTELYKSLTNFKDIFLIGFFLQIGLYGFPPTSMLWIVAALSLLIFLRPLIYFVLMSAFKLRVRTAFLSSLALFNYSEFGLIVVALAVDAGDLSSDWLTTIALALCLSFFIASLFNKQAHTIYASTSDFLHRFERKKRLEKDALVDLGGAEILVLGLGRIGFGAYQYLKDMHPDNIIGVDEDLSKVNQHKEQGINCVHGDASDYDFWQRVDLKDCKTILVSLSNHAENVSVIEQLKLREFPGTIATVCRFPDQQRQLEALGCTTFNLYAEAGYGFAEHVFNK